MARSKQNKPRPPKPGNHPGAWLLIGPLGLLAILVLAISLTESIHYQLAIYISFLLSIFFGWYAIRSGAFYIYGSPIYRSKEPGKFWVFFSISIVPLFLFSSFFVVIHIWSLFSA